MNLNYIQNIPHKTVFRFFSNVLPQKEVPFITSVVLVECSKSLDYRGSCQLPTSPREDHNRVWHWEATPHFLYQQSSFSIELSCSVFGQEGIFRVFLTTDLSHAAIIERSGPIKVRTNREYSLSSDFTTVFPCQSDDIKPLNVRRPSCAGDDDKVRVYGQGISIKCA